MSSFIILKPQKTPIQEIYLIQWMRAQEIILFILPFLFLLVAPFSKSCIKRLLNGVEKFHETVVTCSFETHSTPLLWIIIMFNNWSVYSICGDSATCIFLFHKYSCHLLCWCFIFKTQLRFFFFLCVCA